MAFRQEDPSPGVGLLHPPDGALHGHRRLHPRARLVTG